MGWNTDPELQELFKTELADRVARLVEGAAAMQEGAVDGDVCGAMLREGHTIKGTARVMGFEAISRAGQAIEQAWRRIQHGDLEPHAELGAVLGRLAETLPDAVSADPDVGTPDLKTALASLGNVLSGEGADPPLEAPATEVDRGESEPSTGETSDLGGLLGALETWASEQALRVNAGRLYRLINDTAAIRIDSEALRGMGLEALDIVESVAPQAAESITRLVEAIGGLEKAMLQLQGQALDLAASPLTEITNTLPQLVNYLGKKTGKEIRFELVGDDLAVDRQVLERIAEPLRQLIVNAIEHGIETPAERERDGKPPTATLRVRAAIADHRLVIEVADDGRGIDWEAVGRAALRRGLLPPERAKDPEALRSLLFAPGFSTATEPSELVGDGIGLTAVAEATETLYGNLTLETEPRRGTTVTLTVPTTRALQRAVLVQAANQIWGIPETAIIDVVEIDAVEIVAGPHRMEMRRHDQQIPVASFAAAVGLVEQQELSQIIIVSGPMGSVGLSVSAILGTREVVAKELGPLLSGPPHLTGAALLGGGDVLLLVDPSRLSERARDVPVDTGPRPRVLVVDDSPGARQVVAGALASNGFDTTVAGGVEDAIVQLSVKPCDALVVDFSMPDADGIALVGEVRERFGSLPVVMLSGVATSEDQTRAHDAGVDAYFDKADFREGALAETLRSLITARAAREEVMQR